MVKSTKQLDREIAEALDREHFTGLDQAERRPWWIWLLRGAPRVSKKVELPWAYSWEPGLTEGSEFNRDLLRDFKLRVVPRRFGSMLAVEMTKSGLHQMLTPPLYLFADLKKMDPRVDLTDIGSPRFWIQPDTFQATRGEIYQGNNVRELFDVNRDQLAEAPDQLAVSHVLVALDAYLEKDRPDPRFV